MKNSLLFIVIIILLLGIGGILIKEIKKEKENVITTPPITNYEYYFTEGCEYCTKVAEFMKTWSKNYAIVIGKKDISDANNVRILVDRTSKCGILEDDIGVPLLITPDGKCLSGDQSIIEYLKTL